MQVENCPKGEDPFWNTILVLFSNILNYKNKTWGCKNVKMKKKTHSRASLVKNLPANAGDTGLNPGLGRSHMPQDN